MQADFFEPRAAVAARIYESMLMIRSMEERMEDLYVTMGSGAAMARAEPGWDAVVAPVCAAMQGEDVVLSACSPYSAYLARGGDPVRMMFDMYNAGLPFEDEPKAAATASRLGFAEETVPSRPFFKAALRDLRHYGKALKKAPDEGDRPRVAVFFAPSSEQAHVRDAVRSAERHGIPALFVCADAGASDADPFKDMRGIRTVRLTREQGAFALYDAAAEELERLRGEGAGPGVVTVPSACPKRRAAPEEDGLDYSVQAGLYRWRARDPLAELNGFLDASTLQAVIFSVQDRVRHAEEAAAAGSRHSVRYGRVRLGGMQ
jgi:hypothetical protein